MKAAAIILLLLVGQSALAQSGISGTVVDSVSGAALPKASVVLIRGGKTVKFGRTDDSGHFAIDTAPQPGDELQATLMGYGKKRQPIAKGDNVIRLAEKVFQLREVKVEGPPVSQRRDTVVYDLTKFATDRDNNLQDVLKKLPGVEVEKSGQIKYNGKAISRFTVEGLDLSKGQYNKLTENIRAKDVKKAEVMEHDQPIKALRNRVFTDDVGLNIVMKDSARDQLFATLRPYLLTDDPTHVGGDAVAMQIGKQRQMEYTAQYDRSGRDLSNQFSIFYNAFDFANTAEPPRWHSAPSLQSPIDEERLRMNTSQAYSVDYLTKGRDDSEYSLSVGYNRNVIRQHTQNVSQYFLDGQTPTETTEDRHLLLKQDAFTMDYNHRINAERHYGNIVVKGSASQDDGMADYSGGTAQRTRTPEANIVAAISQTYTLGRNSLSWRSTADYHHTNDKLDLANQTNQTNRSKITNNDWHTAHSLSLNRQTGHWHNNYNLSLEAENLNVGGENNGLIKVGTAQVWNYKTDDWLIYLMSGLTLQRLSHQQSTMLLPRASITVNRDYGNRANWRMNLMYTESAASWSQIAISHRQTDYRTWMDAPEFVPRSRSLASSVAYNYKRAIYQFFSNVRLSYSRQWNDAAQDLQIADGNYHYTLTRHNTHSDNISGSTNISKGWSAIHLKTNLAVMGSYSTGQQYSAGEAIEYHYMSYSFEPEIIFSPKWMEIDYKASFSFNRSKTAEEWTKTLADWTQRLTLISTIGNVDISLSGVLYHNELQSSPSVNTLLADAKLTWRIGKVRLAATLRNLFNKHTYTETTYSGVGIFTNRYWLRPRELMVSVQFSL